jgi:hypothetical protein
MTQYTKASQRMSFHRFHRTDTGVCPYKNGIKIRQVGANTGVRPALLREVSP